MYQLILMFHVVVCIAVVALVLVQHGKGADIGAAFGSGASTTVFGSQGSGSFLMKLTCLLAAVFFFTSIALTHIAAEQAHEANNLQLPTSISQPVNKTQDKTTNKVPKKPAPQKLPQIPN